MDTALRPYPNQPTIQLGVRSCSEPYYRNTKVGVKSHVWRMHFTFRYNILTLSILNH
jgi:hypothetical protein